MTELLLHSKTRLKLSNLISSSPQSILVNGKGGSGKDTVVKHLSAGLLGLNISKLDSYPYLSIIGDQENDKVTVEDIRDISKLLKLKVPVDNASGINRIVIIPNAHVMKAEAQNALLKILEEPPKGTAIILATSSRELLLSTILSRVQEVEILPVSISEARAHYSKGDNLVNFDAMFALSQGQAGLLTALLKNSDHKLLKDINLAKKLLSLPKGDRLLQVDEISKNKQATKQLLEALLRISHAALYSYSKKDDLAAVDKWQQNQAMILDSLNKLNMNVQSKIVLDRLFITV